jgi:FkbH-like protein
MTLRPQLFRFLQRQPNGAATLQPEALRAAGIAADAGIVTSPALSSPALSSPALSSPAALPPALLPTTSLPLVIGLTAHVQGVGDQKAAEDGWAGRGTGTRRIEGFVAACDAPGWREHVRFQAMQRDRSLAAPVPGGVFCGTRGRMMPLHGFVVHVPADAARFAGLVYEGVFEDGFRSGLLTPGCLCVSPRHAALLAMRITTDPKICAAPAESMPLIASPPPAAAKPAIMPNSFVGPAGGEGLWEEGPAEISLIAHIAGKGDTPAGQDGWAGTPKNPKRIEGFSATHTRPGWSSDVVCCPVLADGSLGPAIKGGGYCGTRGKGQPMFGFVVQAPEGRPDPAGIGYEGVFEDGFYSGPLRSGEICASPSRAALVAMRITATSAIATQNAAAELEKIRLVIWDLDEVFWGGTLTEGGIVWREENAKMVRTLAARGIISSICSKNDPEDVFRVLEEHAMRDHFVFPSISWEAKGPRLAALIANVQLRAPSVLFIDDNPLNRAEASAFVPGLQVRDEFCLSRLLDDPLLRGKPDPDCARLEQYRLLERRHTDLSGAQGDTTAFLRASAITVAIEHDIEAHIDRAVELVNRTNQLNFTKLRLPDDPDDPEVARAALRAQFSSYLVQCGLLHVRDRYGDYGFCGFYMLRRDMNGGEVLLHFAFSCRILGMGIETWLYRRLRRPVLPVSGHVVSDVFDESSPVDWVSVVSSIRAEAEGRQPHILRYVLARGACDMRALSHYFAGIADTVFEELLIARQGQATQVGHSLIAAQALAGMPERAVADFAMLGYRPEDFDIALTRPPLEGPAVWLFGFNLECQTPIYRHIKTGAFLPAIITGLAGSPAEMMKGGDPGDADPAVVAHLRKNFIFFGQRPDPRIDDLFRHALSQIFLRASEDVQIFVLLSNTHPSRLGQAPPPFARHNELIADVAQRFPNVTLLLPQDFMTLDELAALDHVHHFDRIVYFRIFQHIEASLKGAKTEAVVF